MKEKDLDFILNVLQRKKDIEIPDADWYSVLGFLELHRVSASFLYNAAELGLALPQQVRRKLEKILHTQKEIAAQLQKWAAIISGRLSEAGVKHACLKGSALNGGAFYTNGRMSSHAYLRSSYTGALSETGIYAQFYRAGERISNDIDILLAPEDITKADKILKGLGFYQGYWDSVKDEIVGFDRKEIISRRMNRGETAPYMQKTENGALPYIEVDINFSLDHLPTGHEKLLSEMLGETRKYKNGVTSLCTRHFFLHLILHQYKEMILHSMVMRNKDNDLYKYYDIYQFLYYNLIYFSGTQEFVEDFCSLVKEYGLQKECYIVLSSTAEIFDSLQSGKSLTNFLEQIAGDMLGGYKLIISDPQRPDERYVWSKPLKRRLCSFDNRKALIRTSDNA
jgi:hypothetical protein